MTDPHGECSRILGPIEWQTETVGFCPCPGQSAHTHRSTKKDCRVTLDRVPTVFCFHTSCAAAIAAANRALRQALPSAECLARTATRRAPGFSPAASSSDSLSPGERAGVRASLSPTASSSDSLSPGERAGARASVSPSGPPSLPLPTRRAPALLWPVAAMQADSPLDMSDRSPAEHFQAWLALWPPAAIVWIGGVFDSGQVRHAKCFRPAQDWAKVAFPPGNFTSASAYYPGSYARNTENVLSRPFMVVESDTLSHEQIGGVFLTLNRRFHFRLHAVVDTAGKSLHGWFDAPDSPEITEQVHAFLVAKGCDPAVFKPAQPVRTPGALRDGRLQRLLWVRRPL